MDRDEQLCRAIAEVALFLEFSDGSVVDPDSAVGLMEQIGSRLLSLPSVDRKHIVDCWERFAGSVEPDSERAQFLRELGINLGLEDET